MRHIIDTRRNAMVSAIELMNNLGLNIVWIDGAFYVFTEFIPADQDNQYISMQGKNITEMVENTLDTRGFDKQRQIELFQKIEAMPSRQREFSPETEWTKYIGR